MVSYIFKKNPYIGSAYFNFEGIELIDKGIPHNLTVACYELYHPVSHALASEWLGENIFI
jgi:hypothetical protein